MHASHRLLPLLVAVVALLLAGCLSPEQRMVIKIDKMMERQQYDKVVEHFDAAVALNPLYGGDWFTTGPQWFHDLRRRRRLGWADAQLNARITCGH